MRPLTDDPERFHRLAECVLWDPARDERETRRIRSARRLGEAVVVRFEGCTTVEAAAALGGRMVALPRSAALPTPEGRFYVWQLVGCTVTTEDGALIGTVTGIDPSPAQDLWVVKGHTKEHLIPAVPDIVVEVNLAERRVVINPPAGLLDL